MFTTSNRYHFIHLFLANKIFAGLLGLCRIDDFSSSYFYSTFHTTVTRYLNNIPSCMLLLNNIYIYSYAPSLDPQFITFTPLLCKSFKGSISDLQIMIGLTNVLENFPTFTGSIFPLTYKPLASNKFIY